MLTVHYMVKYKLLEVNWLVLQICHGKWSLFLFEAAETLHDTFEFTCFPWHCASYTYTLQCRCWNDMLCCPNLNLPQGLTLWSEVAFSSGTHRIGWFLAMISYFTLMKSNELLVIKEAERSQSQCDWAYVQLKPMDTQPLQEELLGDRATEVPPARSTDPVNPSVIQVLHVAIKKQFQRQNVHMTCTTICFTVFSYSMITTSNAEGDSAL